MSTESIIDLATIAELRATGGDAFLGELIDTYCIETPQLIDNLQTALAEGDAVAFRRHAHSIKSSSAAMGALGFAAQARELEYIGRDGDLNVVGERYAALVATYGLVEQALRELQHAA